MLKFLAEELQARQACNINNTSLTVINEIQEEIIYQNTFRIEPSYEFLPDQVSNIIKITLTEKLKGLDYDPTLCPTLACDLSESIKEIVKKRTNFPRHKLVSFVVIGERCDQGAIMGSRCVWNVKFDGYASSSYQNDTLFAVGVLYAVYLE